MEDNHPRFAIGDWAESIHFPGIIKEITAVRKTGYTWKYHDLDGQDFWSENSSDPHFYSYHSRQNPQWINLLSVQKFPFLVA